MADVVVPTVAVPEAMPRYAMPGDAGADPRQGRRRKPSIGSFLGSCCHHMA